MKKIRCAIYTRKSAEEGLEQEFNCFVQRLVVGVEKTGESCSVTVNPDNTVEVSFLGDGVIPVVSTSTEGFVTDIFVAELGNDEVLIVQHSSGRSRVDHPDHL